MDERRSATPGIAEWRAPATNLGELPCRKESLPGTAGCLELERIFVEDPGLGAVIVCHTEDGPVAVTRARFFAHFTGRLGYGRAIYLRRSVQELPLPQTLILPSATSVPDAAAALLRRPREERYEDLVVRFGGGSLGTVGAAELFAELSYKHAFDSHHDGLTGLANRALFRDRLAHTQVGSPGKGGGVAVLFVDVDDFKTINDGLGHEIGNDVLMVVAARLRRAVRAEDTVARVGGDEFAVLVNGVATDADAAAVAERMVAALADSVRIGDSAVALSASVGAALYSSGEPPEELLRNADLAMYAAKRRGKGQYAPYEPAMHVETLKRLDLRSELEGALERGQLALVYQPIIDLSEERIVAVEALLRWCHPWRGGVGPAEFIPLSEETGLIVPIGRWVLQEACRQAQRWAHRRAGHVPLRVAVNISPRQVEDPAIVDHVTEALADSGLAPSALVLEITEGLFVGEANAVSERLHALKRLGVSLALDDFGAGFSSLGYLSRMPLDVLKLDRALIARIGREGERGLVAGIVELARSLGMDAVAEGVERAEQVRHLQAMGCALAQGYLFAWPLDVDTVTLLVEGDIDLAVPAWPTGPDEDRPSAEPGADGLARLGVAGRRASGGPAALLGHPGRPSARAL